MDVKAFSKDIVIDIPDEAFQAGRRLREHKTFERFTRDNGWCYLELIGKVGAGMRDDLGKLRSCGHDGAKLRGSASYVLLLRRWNA